MIHTKISKTIEVYTPHNFEDVYALTHSMYNLTSKNIIIDCQNVRVLPSHFISLAISKNDFIVLINVSHTAMNIFKTIGVIDEIHVFKTLEEAITYINTK